jgi:hypothetical protein
MDFSFAQFFLFPLASLKKGPRAVSFSTFPIDWKGAKFIEHRPCLFQLFLASGYQNLLQTVKHLASMRITLVKTIDRVVEIEENCHFLHPKLYTLLSSFMRNLHDTQIFHSQIQILKKIPRKKLNQTGEQPLLELVKHTKHEQKQMCDSRTIKPRSDEFASGINRQSI